MLVIVVYLVVLIPNAMDKNKDAVALFDKNAEVYQDKYMDLDLYNDTYDAFCNALQKPGAKVLDVACGPGNITRYLLSRHPDFDITGTDLSPNMLRLAAENNPSASFLLMDCRDVAAAGTIYDGIICGFGLPYLSREEAVQFIKDTATVLESGGVLYLSTMEDDYSKSGIQTSSSGDQLYMYYHQYDYLAEALEQGGYRIMLTDRKQFPAQYGPPATDLVIIAVKK